MTEKVYDIIVVGLGAMGSAAIYELARRGANVLGIDRFTPPHPHGSLSGETRFIREAYAGPSQYVSLVHRAFDAWRDLGRRSGRRLFVETGGLWIGPPDGLLVAGALNSVREHNLPGEELSAPMIRKRFPPLLPEDGMVGVLEPRAGILYAEQCIEALLGLSHKQGAELVYNDPVERWSAGASGVEVRTRQRDYRGRKLILSAGAWMPRLLPDLKIPLEVERQVFHWMEPRDNAERFAPDRMPIYLMEYDEGMRWYGFPSQARGIKVGLHHQGYGTQPDAVDPPSESDRAQILAILERFMPDAAGRVLESATCMYTNTPDEDFIIDFHPEHQHVVIASPCSGHGFKFAVVIGEILADLVLEGRTGWDLTLFRLDRFGSLAAPAGDDSRE